MFIKSRYNSNAHSIAALSCSTSCAISFIFCISYATYSINIIIPIIVIPRSNVCDPINMFIKDASIIAINPINKIFPSFVKSILVKCPIAAISPNTSDVIPKTIIIESSLNTIKIIENVRPVKNEYRQYSICAVNFCIFQIPADSQIHTPISNNASIQYDFEILYTIFGCVDTK